MGEYTFKNFIADNFYNQIFDCISQYISANFEELDLGVRYSESTELDDFDIEYIGVQDRKNMSIRGDIVVSASIECHTSGDSINKEKWFSVCFTGDVCKKLSDFQIYFIEEYKGRRKFANPLSNKLVPVIKKVDMDDLAEKILIQYGYEANISTPTPIDVFQFAKSAGLNVIGRNITEDMSVFGELIFEDCDAHFYSREKGEYTERVNGKTIVYDDRALEQFNIGNVHNTIVHEAVHWILHRKAFYFQRLLNENMNQIRCQKFGNTTEVIGEDKLWIERQANSLAPRILMPAKAFKAKADKVIARLLKENNTDLMVDIIEKVIDELAEFFGVSKLSAKIRLTELGYEEAQTAYIYVNGGYVRPHSFKKGALKKFQTYTIDAVDAVRNILTNSSLDTAFREERLKYVEAHICINDPKYITRDEENRQILTEYARLHMDECCLAFELKPMVSPNFKSTYATEYIFSREAGSVIICDVKLSRKGNEKIMEGAESVANVFRDEIGGLYKKMPGQFCEALKYFREWRGLSQMKLAEKSLLSDKTIRRLEKDENATPTVETVVALIVGMELPPILGNALLGTLGYSLQAQNDKSMAYNFIVSYCTGMDIYECNAILKNSFNLPPLTAKE